MQLNDRLSQTQVVNNNVFDLNKLDSFTKARTFFKKSFDKIVRYENHLNMLKTHIENGATPPSLFFNRFPRPMLIDNAEFVDEYNDLIVKVQVEIMQLITKHLNERNETINSDITKVKGIIIKNKNEENLNDRLAELMTVVENDHKNEFKIKNEQTLRCKSVKFQVQKSHSNSNHNNSRSIDISIDFGYNSSNNNNINRNNGSIGNRQNVNRPRNTGHRANNNNINNNNNLSQQAQVNQPNTRTNINNNYNNNNNRNNNNRSNN
jgi:hypothetical protein